jgi:hypothetical protein
VRHDESASTDPVLKSLAWDWNKDRFLARWGGGAAPGSPKVEASRTDLLEAEVAFLERAAEVHEEQLARVVRLLESTRFDLGQLKADHLGALEVLEQERAHGAWLNGVVEAERARAEAAEAELESLRASPAYQRLAGAQSFVRRHRVLGALLRAARRVARR